MTGGGRGGAWAAAQASTGDPPPVALVTGGSKRIGAVIARTLAAAGADVVVHYRSSRDEAESVAAAIRDGGRSAWTLEADLGDPEAAVGLVPAAAGLAGRPVTWLVNNASVFPRATGDDLSWEGLEEALRINAWAPFSTTRAVAAQGVDAAVVDLLDTRLADLDRHHLGYHFSKATLAAMTDAAARLWAPKVRVNAVAPGPILAPVGSGDDAYLERMARLMPLRRTPAPEEVADAVLYLLRAPGVTGQVLRVDAGRHLGRPIEDG